MEHPGASTETDAHVSHPPSKQARASPDAGGTIVNTLGQLATRLWRFVTLRGHEDNAQADIRLVAPAGPQNPGALPETTPNEPGLVQKVVNTTHSVIEHLNQEAAAVSAALKEEAHGPGTSPSPHATGIEARNSATASADRPAGALTNLAHSVVEHIAQDAEAVSATAKQQLDEFMHPTPGSSAGATSASPPAVGANPVQQLT